MASGDVVSDNAVTLGDNTTVDIQPASGDEWLMTHLLVDSTSWRLRGTDGTDDTQNLQLGLFGGTTTVPTKLEDIGLHPLKLMLTNTMRLLIKNESGAEKDFMYSAVKMKD